MNSDTYLSTSAVAHGEALGAVLDRVIADGVSHVEIGIGPRPEPDAIEAIAERVERGVTVTAHANCPLGDGRLLNQERDYTEILDRCGALGITRYSLHALRKRELPSWAEFLSWAEEKRADGDVHVAVETMYPARQPYWLDSYDEVARFLDWADSVGWERPLVADVAHLQIGVVQGTWTDEQVGAVLTSGRVVEFHYSDNDGVHDKHRTYVPGRNGRVDRWLEICRGEGADLVDEGRRSAR